MKKWVVTIGFGILSLNGSSQTFQQLNDSILFYYQRNDYPHAIYFANACEQKAGSELGENHPYYATYVNNLGELYRYAGNYILAEKWLQKALIIRRQVAGPQSDDYAGSLNNLAVLFQFTNRFREADSLFRTAIDIRKKLDGVESIAYAGVAHNLATLYLQNNRYAKAEEIFLEILPIVKKISGTLDPGYAAVLINLANVYQQTGRYKDAEPLLLEALEIRKKIFGERHPDYASALDATGRMYGALSEYDKAATYYQAAVTIFKEVLGTEHPNYLVSLDNLGEVYQQTGHYNEAEQLFTEALTTRKRLYGERDANYAASLSYLAALYYSMGQYAKSEQFRLKAISTYQSVMGKMNFFYATNINGLASVYLALHNYSKAEALYKEAAAICKQIGGAESTDYATVISTLAALYYRMGKYTESGELYLEAIGIYEKVFGKKHRSYAVALYSLGYLMDNAGEYDDARMLYTKASNSFREARDTFNMHFAAVQQALATLNNQDGKYDDAEQQFSSALKTISSIVGMSHPDYAITLSNYSWMYWNQGNFEKAIEYESAANKITTSNMLRNFPVLSTHEKELLVESSLNGNERLLSMLMNSPAIPDTSIGVILDQQLLLKSLVLSDVSKLTASLQTTRDSSIQRRYNEWLTIKRKLSQQFLLPARMRDAKFGEWEVNAEQLEKELTRESSSFRNLQDGLRTSFKDVQLHLDDYEAAIEFVRFKVYRSGWKDSVVYGAFIIKKDISRPVFVPLCEEKQLLELWKGAGKNTNAVVKNLYRGLGTGSADEEKFGSRLYQLIWAPLEPSLEGCKKISYSPAGKLYGIAFHALPADSVTLLTDRYELRQYISTREIAFRNKNSVSIRPSGITLLGDASFTMDSLSLVRSKKKDAGNGDINPFSARGGGPEWNRLPGTAAEVRAISELFQKNGVKPAVYLKESASEDNFKSLDGKASQVIHIATHGFFYPAADRMKVESFSLSNAFASADDPLLRSGLVLAGANYSWSGKIPIAGIEDGIATAYEISQMNLSGTELVVLSACETALGDVKGSEGVYGLQRAFKLAGVKKMIVSLWQVPDRETSELMTTFYQYWLEGKTIEHAFHQAQSAMRKKYAPYYWAAFVLVE